MELSTDTECVGTKKYYLYKKQYRCEDSQEPWVYVVPKETSIYGNCKIYVQSGSLEAYKAASGWSDYASRIQPIPNS